ncbi:MAG: UDP-N-acetylglucosamine--N-acetylmuramyl-(pentapeptide) pyrophosphoryl-undecaprenol N-acetylglucosamine transferase [bacterium]
MKQNILVLVAGGSGGHIIPALQLGKHWKESNNPGIVFFIGQDGTLDQKILKNKDFLHHTQFVKLGKFSLQKFWFLPLLFWQLIVILVKSYSLFKKNTPTKIITTGGLLAIPVCLAGWLQKIPIELHELNVIPGKAIQFLASVAHKIFIVFTKTATYFSTKNQQKCTVQTYPVRFEKKHISVHKENLIRYINQLISGSLKFDISRKTLFILGGSQGSLLLNDLSKKFVINHTTVNQSIQIIHQTGNNNTGWEQFYAKHNIPAFTFNFYKNIEHCYLLADLVLCRAGAGTLFELLFFEKKSIVIPLVASTTDHQIENARAMQAQFPGLFSIIEQKEVQEEQELVFKALEQQISAPNDSTLTKNPHFTKPPHLL